jgi:hypothetical protein
MMGGIFWLDACADLQDVEMCMPSGACCLNDGTCLTDVAADYCSQIGGDYLGDGTTDCYECLSTSCCIESECETDVDFVNCLLAGGEWFNDSTCDSDSCKDQPPCIGDLNENGTVDVDDLLQMLAVFGTSSQGDCDGDKDTDVDDLLLLISAWGVCP